MAKILIFFALFSIQSLFLIASDSTCPPIVEPCEAPAPENFRVTEIIGGDVQLAWSPVWLGAKHTLKVMQIDSNGGWVALSTYPNVPDSTFTLFGLDAGDYRATISTNCDWNQPSQIEKDLRFKIIDLVVGGRVPINPSSVLDCTPIQMAEHGWVGFRVRDTDTGVFNFFEFTFEDGVKATIKRVLNDVIVAADYSYNYPIGNGLVNSFNPVFIIDTRYDGENTEIGYVSVLGSPVDKIVEICIAVDAPAPWKPKYQLTTLTSAMPTAPPGDGAVSPQGMKGEKVTDSWLVQNPFGGTLTLFPPTVIGVNTAIARLLNMQGQLLWIRQFAVESDYIEFSTHHIPIGCYFLHISTEDAIHTFKIQKI